jgi:riboflavin kinase/FMN adenylyltransferase
MAEPPPGPFGTRGSVITVGTFDGLHRGHAALLEALREVASKEGVRPVVATFDPHPLRVVRPQDAPQLLTTRAEKLELLSQLGVDAVVLIAFDQHLASYAPDEFVREILVSRLGARHLVIGYDHGFGRGRSGDATTLRSLGAREGFTVDVVEPVIEAGAPVSSSRIRQALSNGDLAGAASGLGRAYSLRGTVVRGDGRGRTLGFPTANLAVPDPTKLLPQEGIYAVRADIAGVLRDGVLHLGARPTYAGAAATVELHLFDFDEDLYGEDVGVRFCTRLRGVERFTGSAALAAAIAADCAAARRVLSEDGGACGHGVTWLASKAV